ncbi:MAG: HD domain-containing protein [Eubacterium sp.]|nr:HD domain-containing protein [Eubacterium sp.]
MRSVSENRRRAHIVTVCLIGIVLNMLGSEIVRLFKLPIFLDTVGTLVISVMSGYLPGIIVGLFTNLLKSIQDSSAIYYAFINVLVAVIASRFSIRDRIKKPLYAILMTSMIAFIGGVHEGLLVWVREEFTTEMSVAKSIWGFVVNDFIDKAVSVIILELLLVFLPMKIQELLKIEGWQQTPLTPEEIKTAKKTNNRIVSLRTKILALIIAACVTIGLVAMVISVVLYRQYTIDEHFVLADSIATLVVERIDGNKVNDFIEKGEDAEGYKEVENLLYQIRESSKDIEYIYVYKILEDGCHVVFDLDTEDMPGSKPGEIVPFDASFSEEIPELLEGKEIEPKISDDTYGWLITVYKPVYDQNGVCQCYAAVDISMDVIKNNELTFLVKMLSLFLGFIIFVIAVGLWISEYNIVLPVNTMAISASAFAFDNEETLEENVEQIKKLNIHTGDEIENMYQAFTKTTENSVNYMNDIQNKTEMIANMQDALIMVLADMVESRDENTGDHVKKTAAYTRIIMDKLREIGIYTDQLTDQFVSDVERSAPLHDIGKISISDTILNKPGKLTDEEFEIMKTHTISGAAIIDQAIEKLPESGYLEEAKNIALYHHEKWNGRGYPYGLSGEDIPLSARIMAVADVFDALVSERCYKKAFSFDEAMDIIKKDAGSHFDPMVAEAFLQARERVSEVMERISVEIPNKKK